ncbi:hypothetical protein ACH47Z_03490 [Streptomyces sp. NPDC020192]|uniref:hypothetical protein n=1 Tax=Streptomyces sp. NPDC020192 TaxID=3365066 RepID=UPI0037B3851F
MRRFRRLPSLLAVALFATGLGHAPTAQAAPAAQHPAHTAAPHRSGDSGSAVHHDTSPPLRTLHAAHVSRPGGHPAKHR